MHPHAIGEVGQAQARAGQHPSAIGIPERTVAQPESLAPRSLRDAPVHQAGKIQSEIVSIALAVGTLNLAQLALETRVDDLGRVGGGDLPDIAIVFVVDE